MNGVQARSDVCPGLVCLSCWSQVSFEGEDVCFAFEVMSKGKQRLVMGVADGVGGSRMPGDKESIVAGAGQLAYRRQPHLTPA